MASTALPFRQQDSAASKNAETHASPGSTPTSAGTSSFLPEWLPSPLSIPSVFKPHSLARLSLGAWPSSASKKQENDLPQSAPEGKKSASNQAGGSSNNSDTLDSLARSGSVRSKMSRRYSAPKQTFQLAYPPPRIIKPRLLLQLQHTTSKSSRPVPSLDVVPATLINKKARRVSRNLKSGEGHHRRDIAVLPADTYEKDISSLGDNDEPRPAYTKEPCGIISFSEGSDGSAEGGVHLTLNDGSVWSAKQLPNGNYEFRFIDKSGQQQVARWVLRGSDVGNNYSFSPIDPHSRRHPRIGILTSAELSINESYKPPPTHARSASFHRQPLKTSRSSSPVKNAEGLRTLETVEEETIIETSDQLRTLMIVSAVWIVKKEGWSSTAQLPKHASPTRRNSQLSHTRGRARSIVSLETSTPETLSGCEGNPPTQKMLKRNSLPARFALATGRSGSYSEKQSPLWAVSSEDSLGSATSRSRANTKDSATSSGTTQSSFGKPIISPPVVEEAPSSEEEGERAAPIPNAGRPKSWCSTNNEVTAQLLKASVPAADEPTTPKSLLKPPSLTLSVPKSRTSVNHSPVSETYLEDGKEEKKSRRISGHFDSLKRVIRRRSLRA